MADLDEAQIATLEGAGAALHAAHAGIPLLVAELRRCRERVRRVAETATAATVEHRRGCAACQRLGPCADGDRLLAVMEAARG